jgi:hypothetical protein
VSSVTNLYTSIIEAQTQFIANATKLTRVSLLSATTSRTASASSKLTTNNFDPRTSACRLPTARSPPVWPGTDQLPNYPSVLAILTSKSRRDEHVFLLSTAGETRRS